MKDGGPAFPRPDAEIEALRAEVEAWRELSDHVRVGACKAIWPGRYIDERIRDVAAVLKRLAVALEDIRSRSSIDLAMRPDPFELTAMMGNIHQIADAALAQPKRRPYNASGSLSEYGIFPECDTAPAAQAPAANLDAAIDAAMEGEKGQ